MGVETNLSNGIIQIDIPNNVSVAFDVDAFDEAIAAHGVKFEHWRAMRSPLGLIDKFDSRRPEEAHGVIGGLAESNGMIYTKAGCVHALFTGNSKDLKSYDGGVLNSGVAQITAARFYINSQESVFLAPWDRLFVEDCSVLVTHQQLVQAHITGRDRLAFPAVQVQDVVDSGGVRYNPSDFEINGGQIVWNGSKRPATNQVYAVRYLYRPYWQVDNLMHEVRLAQIEDNFTGERSTARMPSSARVMREYLYLTEDKDPQSTTPNSPRQVPGPASGSLGPR
jgi:hypothetical protein